MATKVSNSHKLLEQQVQSKRSTSTLDSIADCFDGFGRDLGTLINACAIKPIRILSNTLFTATNAVLTDRPTSLETALAVPAFIYGKEAMSHGSNCVSLNAGRNLLFGDIGSTINTYWTSKSWSDLFSTTYLQSIYDGLTHISGRLSIEEMQGCIGRYISAKSPQEIKTLIESTFTTEMKNKLGGSYEQTVDAIQANLQDLSQIPEEILPTSLDSSFLESFGEHLNENILEKFNDAECLRFSANAKIAAPFIVAIVALIVGRISYKVIASTCSDIYQKYFAKPSSHEVLIKAVEDVKTVVENAQIYLEELVSDTDIEAETTDEGIEVEEEAEIEENDDDEGIDDTAELSQAEIQALKKLAKQRKS